MRCHCCSRERCPMSRKLWDRRSSIMFWNEKAGCRNEPAYSLLRSDKARFDWICTADCRCGEPSTESTSIPSRSGINRRHGVLPAQDRRVSSEGGGIRMISTLSCVSGARETLRGVYTRTPGGVSGLPKWWKSTSGQYAAFDPVPEPTGTKVLISRKLIFSPMLFELDCWHQSVMNYHLRRLVLCVSLLQAIGYIFPLLTRYVLAKVPFFNPALVLCFAVLTWAYELQSCLTPQSFYSRSIEVSLSSHVLHHLCQSLIFIFIQSPQLVL